MVPVGSGRKDIGLDAPDYFTHNIPINVRGTSLRRNQHSDVGVGSYKFENIVAVFKCFAFSEVSCILKLLEKNSTFIQGDARSTDGSDAIAILIERIRVTGGFF